VADSSTAGTSDETTPISSKATDQSSVETSAVTSVSETGSTDAVTDATTISGTTDASGGTTIIDGSTSSPGLETTVTGTVELGTSVRATTEVDIGTNGPETTIKDVELTGQPTTEFVPTVEPTVTFADISTEPVDIGTNGPETTVNDVEATTIKDFELTGQPTTEGYETTAKDIVPSKETNPPDVTIPTSPEPLTEGPADPTWAQPTTDFVFDNMTTAEPDIPTIPGILTTDYTFDNITNGSPLAELTTGASVQPEDLTTEFPLTTGKDNFPDLTTGVSMPYTDAPATKDNFPELTTGVSAGETGMTIEGQLPNDNNFIVVTPLAQQTTKQVVQTTLHYTTIKPTTQRPTTQKATTQKATTKKVVQVEFPYTTRKLPTTTEYTDCIHGYRQAADDVNSTTIQTSGTFGGYFLTDDECRNQCSGVQTMNCVGFMFEPQNNGKCILFNYIFNGYDIADGSSASLWFLC